jgi:hypothetical protein
MHTSPTAAEMTPEALRSLIEASAALEPWLGKKDLAKHYSCSVRSIETALAEGMPHAVIFGRVKFQVSCADAWLRERGHLREADEPRTVVTSSNGAGTADTAPRPTTGG